MHLFENTSQLTNSPLKPLTVIPIPAFQDNYIWAIHNEEYCTVVDPGDASPVIDFLRKTKLKLEAILITHHHYDHVNGIKALLEYSPAPVYGPKNEILPQKDVPLSEDDQVKLTQTGLTLTVLDVPGHTSGHIAYVSHFNNETHLFCGDTLFSVGCGRLFEGTPEQMVKSLRKLLSLGSNVKVYPTHEYTLSNIQWALRVDPDNTELTTWAQQAKQLRQDGFATLPTTLRLEQQVNPFLRIDTKHIKQRAELQTGKVFNTDVDVFMALREWKNNS